jgi:hypothetical protein
MPFDINEVTSNMLAAIKDAVKDDWKMVKESAIDFLQDHKSRLELLASLRLSDDISEEIFLARLKDEKKILESQLHAIVILSKVTAQNAANAAINVLSAAVSKALGIGIL